jgi:hypothetical protein
MEVMRVMLSTIRRKVILTFACVALVGGVVAPVAGATLQWYNHNDHLVTIAPGSPWVVGPPNMLTGNSANVGGSACIGAIDYYGGTTVSGATCGSFPWGLNGRSYCGCILRDGAVYPFGSGTGQVGDAIESY